MKAAPRTSAAPRHKVLDWRKFWDGGHSIYTGARHREVHYRKVAADILDVLPAGARRVLDFGCGEALHAELVADRCERLYLADAAPSVITRLEERFGNDAGVLVLPSDMVPDLPDGTLDLVVVNSVAQYLTSEELDRWLRVFRAKLTRAGRVVLADILPPNENAIGDALALLRLARREGFLLSAATGLVATFLSDYRRLRRTVGLTRYAEPEMLARLGEAGYRAIRRDHNFGFNPSRMTFIASPLP